MLSALALQIAGWAIHPPGEELVDLLSPVQLPSHALLFLSWVLAVLGLPAFYLRQASRAGWLGVVGYVLVILVAVHHLYLLLFELGVAPVLARDGAGSAFVAPGGPLFHGGAISMVAMPLILGWPIFGVATLRARIFPAWSGWLQIAAPVVGAVGFPLFGIFGWERLPGVIQPIAWTYYLLFIAYGAVGRQLLRESRELSAPPGWVPPLATHDASG